MAISKKSKFFAASLTAAVTVSAVAPTILAAELPEDSQNLQDNEKEALALLMEAGVVKGDADTGDFRPGESINRAEASVMLSAILELDVDNAPAADFPDVDQEAWYAKYVNAVAAEEIVVGDEEGNFNWDSSLTRAEFAQMVFKAYGLEVATAELPFEDLAEDAWYTDAIATLYANDIIAGKTATTFGPNDSIRRVDTARLLAGADLEFGTYLQQFVEADAPAVESVSAIDVNKVEVKFNGAVDTSKAVVKLTKGLANYNITTEWNEAKDTVVITSVLSKLSPADYTVVVEGLTETALTANVKFETETASELVVTTSTVDVASDATVYFNVLNQYGTKFTTVDPTKLTVNTTESIGDVSFSAVTEGTSTDASGNLKGDFTITNSNKLKAGDSFKVTAVYEGLTATTNVTFVDPIDLATLSFGQVAPLKDKTRITVGDEDLVVPYTAVDQYGAAYELTSTGGITWVSSDSDIVDVDSLAIVDKNLTVDAGTKAGTAIITAILADGSTSQFTVTVEAEAYAKTVSISAPTTLVADGEKASLDIVVQDQFGEVIPNKDVTGLTFSGGFDINPKTGKLEGTVTENSAFKVTAKNSDDKELAAVTFAVEAEAVANTISAINFPSVFEVGATKTLTLDDVVVKDQYGRTFKASSVEVTEADATNNNFSVDTNGVKALEAGTKVFKVAVDDSASAVKNITLTAVASKNITSYELAPIGTIYNDDAYAATPELIGKTSDGKSVVLVAGKIASLTSSNENVAVINDLYVVGNLGDTAADATSTIRAWDANGTLLGSTVVTVTNVAPKLNSIVAADTLGTSVASVFTSKDQYGKPLDEEGTWYFTSTATNGATTSAELGTLTFDDDDDTFTLASGEYAVKFVSKDGETVATSVITLP